MASSPRFLWFLLASSFLLSSRVGGSGALAQNASISWIEKPTRWQEESLMHLQISAPESQDAAQLTYDIYPLTRSAGSNQTEAERNSIRIRGMLVYADDEEMLRDPDTIVFLNCDPPDSTEVVQDLTNNKPRAILLYSLKGNCCLLQGSYVNYTSIFTMANTDDTWAAMNNTRFAGAQARATITGNTNSTGAEPGAQEHNGNNSAVAMSILYSITGLITLLFLVIIATGAIRAHRYPERYGPRSGHGGRPRQSRAKGLARAVLETLPIVKFGDPAPGKPDPALELESQVSRSSPEPGIGTRLSAIPEEPKTPAMRRLSEAVPMSGAVPEEPETTTTTTPIASQGVVLGATNGGGIGDKAVGRISEEHLGCSICTEDFTVGEDVRVLPCDHKFHPPCIDPWLINVSGTCPLCRLDLRPHSEQSNASDDPLHLAPPLAEGWHDDAENITTTRQQRRRSSRLLDLHRLRNASIEERIEILRRHRSQQQLRETAAAAAATESQPQPTETEEQQRGRRAKLSDRLRDRFRVRTRTQQPLNPPPTSTGAGPTSTSEV
ncbi:E3 ubiquitin-protein ligase SDIR1 [Podospora australis]|uniref:E3 ubiquitin-protein ligase SDIR1 n=1 Tax=Podospora australis TaxID=1536484 RepID=A0AAN7AI56_9PEZI|nr:E3 ubiquitin-protein ligase SDIR1 [Podospora australis]